MTYAAILALIPAVAGFLGASLLMNSYGISLGTGFFLTIQILSFIIGLVVIYLMGIIAGALAPSFGGVNSQLSGLKLVVHAATAVWIAGILSLIPQLSLIAMLVGLGYGGYLLFLGATPVMKVPEDKAAGYTAVLIVIWIVLSILIGVIAQSLAWSIAGPKLVVPFG